MNGVPCICMDPHLLSLPQVGRSSQDDVEDFVSAVVDWAASANGKCTTVFVSSRVLDAIEDDGAFPWESDLKRTLKHFNVRSADAETVTTAMQSLCGCARIDDAIGIRGLLLDSSKASISPAFIRARLRDRTQEAFVEQLALIAFAQKGFGRDVDHVALGSVPAGSETASLAYISFAAEITDVEWAAGREEEPSVCPCSVDCQLPVFFSRDGLLKMVEPVSLWPDDTNDIDAAREAIDCCITRLNACETSGRARARYMLGPSFLETAQRSGCGYGGHHTLPLIESCARVVLSIPKKRVKEFTDSVKRDPVVRQKDGARALRTHISERGEALRLMLWMLPDGSIEFANVGVKAELAII